MHPDKQISALFTLLDDPDEEVYSTISEKIISFGRNIIPDLESLWENTPNEAIQERIELLIQKLHFNDLYTEFDLWQKTDADLLRGACICARFHYPDLLNAQVFQEIEKIRKYVWLELNNYLTPLEKTNILSGIIYSYYKIKGIDTDFAHPEHFLINKTLESKTGNVISNGIIYLVLAEMLDIPVYAIQIPRQFILAYFDKQFNPEDPVSEKILFYIDPLNGLIYTRKDIQNYFKRISAEPSSLFFEKMSTKGVVKFLLSNFMQCFDNAKDLHKKNQLESLIQLLEE